MTKRLRLAKASNTSLFVAALFTLLLLVPRSAHATCAEDCGSSCCGDDGLCKTDEQIRCVTKCLKDCRGKDVPPVSAPKPVD